jgi:hypothetical protein
VLIGKTRSVVFSPKNPIFNPFFFYPKHLENTIKTLLNQSIATEKPKNRPKTRKSTRNKNSSRAEICCFTWFERKKKYLNVIPPHHIEHFDTKINLFNCRNLPQWPLSLSRLESEDSLNKKRKKEENEVRYQNVLSWNSRSQSLYTKQMLGIKMNVWTKFSTCSQCYPRFSLHSLSFQFNPPS